MLSLKMSNLFLLLSLTIATFYFIIWSKD
jgi:hypothetical protein